MLKKRVKACRNKIVDVDKMSINGKAYIHKFTYFIGEKFIHKPLTAYAPTYAQLYTLSMRLMSSLMVLLSLGSSMRSRLIFSLA